MFESLKDVTINLHWAIIADVIVEIFGMLGRRSSRVFVRRPGSFVRIVGAFGESATDFVSGRPHHLRVMADFEQIVLRRAVGEIVFLQEPRLGGEHPVRQNTRNVNPFEMKMDETKSEIGSMYFTMELDGWRRIYSGRTIQSRRPIDLSRCRGSGIGIGPPNVERHEPLRRAKSSSFQLVEERSVIVSQSSRLQNIEFTKKEKDKRNVIALVLTEKSIHLSRSTVQMTGQQMPIRNNNKWLQSVLWESGTGCN